MKFILPKDILTQEYDKVYIGSMTGLDAITEQLVSLGVPRCRIVRDLPLVQIRSRVLFLERFAEMAHDADIKGAVAEAGVYKGDYAKEINRCFPDRTLYLFDTFSGFAAEDIVQEKGVSMTSADYLKQTSEELVIRKMPYREKCIIRKGYFPDTADGLDEKFAFVSLDMDLYSPTLAGLNYFYPRMASKGVIVLHDYFSVAYPGVKTAVDGYCVQTGHEPVLCPIGDDISVAIIKTEDKEDKI